MKKIFFILMLLSFTVSLNAQEREDIKMLKQEALKGDVTSMTTLGQHYQYSENSDMTEALKWYEMAAEAGDSFAMQQLSNIYLWNYNDNEKSIYWLKKAADQENPATDGTNLSMELAFRCLNAKGEAQDIPTAMTYWKKCADAGDFQGNFWIGCCHFYGIGTAKEPQKAIEFFSEAASSGSADAMNALAYCHFNGIAFPKDVHKAVEIYESVLPYNHRNTLLNMAYCLENGIGVAQDKTTAKQLKERAELYKQEPMTDAFDYSFRIGENDSNPSQF